MSNLEETQAHLDQPAEEKQERKSQATILVEIAERTDLFHDSDGNGYARLCIGDHFEIWPIRSRGFKDWLAHGYYRRESRAPNVSALNDALATLGGQARFDGPEDNVAIRVAEHQGAIYLDLCNAKWHAVEIDRDGWRVVQDPPVRFVRSRGMLALPAPVEGAPDLIWSHVNVTEADRPLVRAWLDAAIRPTGPYPILLLQGEQGTGKSTQAKVLRSLIDPLKAALRPAPRDERDLMIAGRNSWVVALDNLSGLSGWVSDALCRIATGGGFATRELYSDADETLIDIQRPIILNGIDAIASRQDLIDRSLVINLEPIPEAERVEEAEFWRQFYADQPALLGTTLDRISRALRMIDQVQLERLPRMADFAKWAYAAGGDVEFLDTYNANRQDAIAAGLEGSPVADAIKNLIQDRDSFTGTSTALLDELTHYADEKHVRLKSWPKSAKNLTNQIKRLATAMRAVGIDANQIRSPRKRTRLWQIKRVRENVSDVSELSENKENQQPSCGHIADTSAVCGHIADTSGNTATHCNKTVSDTSDTSDTLKPALTASGYFAPLQPGEEGESL